MPSPNHPVLQRLHCLDLGISGLHDQLTEYLPPHLTDPPAGRVPDLLIPPPNHPALQRLHHLDRSLPGFHDQLHDVLYGEEYQRCVYGENYQQRVVNPQGDDLAWLVDHLDKARTALPFRHPLFRSTST